MLGCLSGLAPKIVSGNTVAGIAGSAIAESHSNCAADGDTGCISTVSYRAANVTGLASKVLSGQTVAATSGNVTLPAVGSVLTGTSFGVNGTGSTGTLTLPSVANVRVSNGTFGISGTGSTPTLADCSANNVSGCVTTATYKSADFTNITAGNIKAGVIAAGVSGNYPSSTYPLSGNTATADLTAATFDAKVKSSAAFEWFDSTGALQTGAGDTDIAAANIVNTVTIFGTTGSIAACTGDGLTNCVTTNRYKSVDTASLTVWDLRYGKTAGGLTGLVRTSCQNRINSSIYNQDTTVTNAVGTSGTANDWWDTIDNWNNNANNTPTTTITGFGAESTCDTSTSVWMDMTTDGVCDTNTDDCIFYDRITQLYWSEANASSGSAPSTTGVSWATAVTACDSLSFGGFTDWRLPTQADLMMAGLHGMRDLGYKGGTSGTTSNNSFFNAEIDTNFLWTATSGSADPRYAWRTYMADNTMQVDLKSNTGSGANKYNYQCVRP